MKEYYMKRTFYRVTSLLVIMVTLVVQAGAADLITETPVATEAVTELGLALADIPETISAEQTVDAEHVERLRDEEVDTNTAVFRNADGTNTLYVFSEDIWYYDEQGNKVDYTTEIEPVQNMDATAYQAVRGGGELLLPGLVGESAPIRYTEGLLDISMYPTTDKILFPEHQAADTDPLLKPSARPETGLTVEAPAAVGEQEQAGPEPSVSGIEQTQTTTAPPVESDGEQEQFPAAPPAEDLPQQSQLPADETAETAEAEPLPEAVFTPVSPKAIVSISSAEELQALTTANANASHAAGKVVNRGVLSHAADAPDRQCVEYFRASRDASIVTTPLLHGVKNDIVLSSYSGNNTYSFVVDTGGLVPTESMGDSITLLDTEGNMQAYLNIGELKDAGGNCSMHNRIDIAPYEQPGKYLVMVTLDEAFLTDPDTVYPVAAAASSQTVGASYINDADVNSSSPSNNYANSTTLWAGYINGAKYRSYIQFIMGSFLSSIAPDNITNSYLILYEKSGNTSSFTLQPRIPGNTWSYTSLTWNNQPSMLASYNGVSAPGNLTLTQTSTMYQLPMTTFVKACMRNYVNDQLPNTIHELRGIALKISNEASAQVRMFNSTNASSNKPTLVIYYNPIAAPTGVTVSPNSALVSAGNSKQLSASVSPSGAPQGVSWSSSNIALATVSSSGLVSTLSPGVVTITAKSTKDTSKKGTSIITINPVSYTTVSSGKTYSSTLSAGQHRWYKFTPTVSGDYTFATTGSTDTAGELYQGSTLLITNDNGGAGNNFSITRSLTSGTQYRLKVKGASTSVSGSFTLGVNVAAPTGVTVSPNSATVSAGSTKQLSASVSPSGAPQGVSWSAGNTAIATVSSSGLVSALSPGTVTITAASTTDSSKKGTCIVSVNPVSTSYASVTAGSTYNFTLSAGQHRWYKFTPAESRAYTFTTTGSIDTYGELHQGTTVLTADDNSGDGSNFLITRPLTAGTQYFIKIRGASTSVSGNSVLSVSAAQISPTGVTVSPGSSSVSAGGTKQLSASVSPAGALQSVTWSSGNTAIATVSSSGLVSALSPGEVTITAAAAASSSVKGTATVTVAPSANSYAIISFGDNLYFDSSDSPLTTGQHRWYKFTPTETRRYVLTTSGTLDTVGELYQGETLLSSDDDGGAGSNFLIERDLTAGTAYRLKVKGANSSVSGSFSLKVDRLYSLTVKHYYDEGYVDRFSNASSQLSSYQNVCSSILYQLYGLQISSTTQNYHSVCDECKILQDMTRPFSESHLNWSCTHTENHLFADARMNDIISQFGTGSSTITRVSWTGHATPGQANFFRGDGLIHLLYMDWAEDYDYKRTYLHELSHSIGAQDHYCNGDENGGVCTTGQCFKHVLRLETRPICVMSCRRDNIETMGIDNVYCSYCDGPNGTIRTHLANHH